MANIELKKVSKIFDKDITAVNSVNISVADKEFVILVGPSGCGKSTILRMVAGLEEISSGEVLIDGLVVNNIPPKDRDIAMVFQNYALYPHMTVFQNMAFGLKLRKYSGDEIKKRVYDAANILDISDLLDRKPKKLSGGQRQRVAVGRAIVRKPKVFLFDEPLSNLDAKLRVQMRTELAKLHSRLQSTMIYVTHDQVEAMTMGSKIVVLKDGFVQQIDNPLNIYSKPKNKFVAGFIGSPPMNFIEGEIIVNGDLYFVNDNIKLKIAQKDRSKLEIYNQKKLILGIRPESIYQSENGPKKSNICLGTFNVDVVEPMGNEVILYLSSGTTSIVARVDPDLNPPVNSNCTVAFDMKKAYFFDSDTDESI